MYRLVIATYIGNTESSVKSQTLGSDGYSVKRISDREIGLTIKAAGEGLTNYAVGIHKSATKNGKFAQAFINSDCVAESEGIKQTLSYGVSSFGENPEITFTPIKSLPDEAVSRALENDFSFITAYGAFFGMTVSSFSVSGDKVTVGFSGKPKGEGFGKIGFGDGKAEKAFELTVPVSCDAIIVGDPSFEMKNGKLVFDADSLDGRFTGNEKGKFFVGEKEAEIIGLSEDRKKATLSLETGFDELDEAVDYVRGKILSVSADAMDYGRGTSTVIHAYKPTLVVSFNEILSDEGYLKVNISLYPDNGIFNGFSAEDLSFSGEFKDSEVVSFTKISESRTDVILKLRSNKAIVGDNYLTGGLTVKGDSLRSSWGTVNSSDINANVHSAIRGVLGDPDTGKAVAKAADFVKESGTLSSIGGSLIDAAKAFLPYARTQISSGR